MQNTGLYCRDYTNVNTSVPTMFDTEKFICEIERRPGLYDLKSKEYSNRDKKAALWNEIAREMYDNWENLTSEERNRLGKELQVKWKSIRDQFKRELNLERKSKSGEAAKKKKKYIFYDQLLFLRNFVESRATTSNIEHDTQEEESQVLCHATETEDKEVDNAETTENIPRTTKIKGRSNKNRVADDYDKANKVATDITTILKESVSLQRQDRLEDVHGNKAFLLSLLPILNNMTPDESFYVRFKFMELIQQLKTTQHHPFSTSQHIPQQSHLQVFSQNPHYIHRPSSNHTLTVLQPLTTQSQSTHSSTISASIDCTTAPILSPRTPATSEDSQFSIIDLYDIQRH